MKLPRLNGDETIRVYNPLFENGYRDYKVLRIEGNKAITNFRDFNVRIYDGDEVYEYGKRLSPIYNNFYEVIYPTASEGFFEQEDDDEKA